MRELGNSYVKSLKESATLKMNDKAKKMICDGIDVVNLAGGELNEVETTGYKGPGQPFGCPAQPTIILMWPCVTHKKTARAVCAPL